MSDEKKENLVSSAELGAYLGKTDRHVQKLAKEGILTVIKKGTKNYYNLYIVIQEYIEHLANRDTQKYSSLEEEKLSEEIRLKRAKASIAQLEFEEIEGTMHRADDVEAMTNDLVFNIRSALMAMPGRLAVDTATLSTPAETSERIRKEVHSILSGLSEYKYDPEEYKRRVRDRQGWKTSESNEEE